MIIDALVRLSLRGLRLQAPRARLKAALKAIGTYRGKKPWTQFTDQERQTILEIFEMELFKFNGLDLNPEIQYQVFRLYNTDFR